MKQKRTIQKTMLLMEGSFLLITFRIPVHKSVPYLSGWRKWSNHRVRSVFSVITSKWGKVNIPSLIPWNCWYRASQIGLVHLVVLRSCGCSGLISIAIAKMERQGATEVLCDSMSRLQKEPLEWLLTSMIGGTIGYSIWYTMCTISYHCIGEFSGRLCPNLEFLYNKSVMSDILISGTHQSKVM